MPRSYCKPSSAQSRSSSSTHPSYSEKPTTQVPSYCSISTARARCVTRLNAFNPSMARRLSFQSIEVDQAVNIACGVSGRSPGACLIVKPLLWNARSTSEVDTNLLIS
ncbi:hypothetical protein HMPREF0298_0023 [Corynebacterium lipophiloflavum DSM 44291]|uniref:Uncharacterized protein n=1 Tax=Corynebacterium lipophiloflavum (strain ATCC 700352 / DSM 44291 / CCUG 37336 / JCM 10383 / DMMZ 1944) TaxID=525263 RepID=C0XNK3_CORLD|nr:hypothetical protein HMPREF0298_0023 [Corynebacterium lipophiloflavum DSM 44291]